MKTIDKNEAMKMFPLALVLSMASLVGVAQADVKKICIGEAISSRAISHGRGRDFDSAIGAGGEDCLFSANSAVGRQIDKVCHIRDVNSRADRGILGGGCRHISGRADLHLHRLLDLLRQDGQGSEATRRRS
jgi:hypothetical protein